VSSTLRIFWNWNSQPEQHHTDVEVSRYTGEAEIKELIGISLGDPALGQYIAINCDRLERVKSDSA
jgi:hypothetical protein